MFCHYRLLAYCVFTTAAFAQTYAPEAGMPGSTAIDKNSPLFKAWATAITVERGYINKSNPEAMAAGSHFASAGTDSNALGFPDGNTVSLGDGGTAILTFANPITDAAGFDFAVFENGSTTYLELAFVEVSSDGVHFFRFPNESQTQTATQLGTFGTPAANYLNNLAGKYASQYGTPFDISALPDDALLDKSNISHVKIIDVVGSIDSAYASYDSFGHAVNDSFPTPFASCGFDLQAVGVINALLGNSEYDFSGVCIFPNPAADRLYIEGIENVGATIFDSTGKVMFNAKKIQNGIEVSQWQPGVYFIDLFTATHRKTIKIIKK